MMRTTLALLLIFGLTSVQIFAGAATSSASPPLAAAQEDEYQVSFTPEQLENLLAPIALYPDPLLAQVLLAATFPDQVDQAARTIRAYGNSYSVDSADWDVSVKAVAHYPTVLSMMADKIDWTTSVGQAYVNQSSDVMDAIQRLRQQARSYGNLVTTPQQEIVETDGDLYIYPAQPQYIYVPIYDPAIIYFQRPGFSPGPLIWFSAGFIIGAWLNHDCDWHHRRVFYHGWENGPAWIVRSRPYVRISNVYVDRRYQNVTINRGVLDHRVNYGALDRYKAIHRDTDFSNVRHERGVAGGRGAPGVPAQPHPDNQIIRRNINPNDPRIDANRGHGNVPQTPPVAGPGGRPDFSRTQPAAPQPRVTFPPSPAPQPPAAGAGRQPEDFRRQPDLNRTQPPAPQPRYTSQAQPAPQQLPQHPSNVQPRVGGPVFNGSPGPISTQEASRRGQASRDQANRGAGGAGSTPRIQNSAPVHANQPGRPQGGRPR